MPAGIKNAFAALGNSDSEEEEAPEKPAVEEAYEAAPVEVEPEQKKKGKKKGKAETTAAAAPAPVPSAPAEVPAAKTAPKAVATQKEPQVAQRKEKKEKSDKKDKPAVASKNKFSALLGSDEEEDSDDE